LKNAESVVGASQFEAKRHNYGNRAKVIAERTHTLWLTAPALRGRQSGKRHITTLNHAVAGRAAENDLDHS
jgi:hypothetical protein